MDQATAYEIASWTLLFIFVALPAFWFGYNWGAGTLWDNGEDEKVNPDYQKGYEEGYRAAEEHMRQVIGWRPER